MRWAGLHPHRRHQGLRNAADVQSAEFGRRRSGGPAREESASEPECGGGKCEAGAHSQPLHRSTGKGQPLSSRAARSSESNRTHGARAAPNLALRARKPHLDGLLRCRRCGLGQERCAGPGCTRTGGIRGSETRPTSKAQNSGAGARRSAATRKRAPTGPRGRCRADPSGGASSGPNKRGPTPCNRPQASPDEAVRALPERSRHTAGSRATQPPRRWRPNATADQPLPRGTQRCSLHVCSAAIARA